MMPFSFFGPTCDSADVMRGPFVLPADVAEGDWIEIGQLGAYGACLRTAFNGFDRARIVEVSDAARTRAAPWLPEVKTGKKGTRTMQHVAFGGRLVMLGFGSIGQGVLPLILRHIDMPRDRISIISGDARGEDVAAAFGVELQRHAADAGQFPRCAVVVGCGRVISC